MFVSSVAVDEARAAILVSIHSYAQCVSSRGSDWSISFLIFSPYLVKMYAAIESPASSVQHYLDK